jgi:hypothetical protein
MNITIKRIVTIAAMPAPNAMNVVESIGRGGGGDNENHNNYVNGIYLFIMQI